MLHTYMKKTGLLGKFKALSTEPDNNNLSGVSYLKWKYDVLYITNAKQQGEYKAQPENTPTSFHDCDKAVAFS